MSEENGMQIIIEESDNEKILKDSKGRIIIRVKDGRCAIARFPNMDERIKKYIAEVYADITGRDINKAMSFLNYETDENEFCV